MRHNNTLHRHSAADWEVTETTSDWGSPVAVVRITGGPFTGEVYRLRTTKGMPGPAAARIEQHRYHLDLIERDGHEMRHSGDWYGAFDTDDLGEALSRLVAELDLWAADEAVHWELDGKLAHLRELLGDALEYDQRRTHRSLRHRWPQIQDAYLALEMGFFQKPGGPPIPIPPAWVWQAPLLVLDRATDDGRLLSAQGTYSQRSSGAIICTDPQTHGQSTCGRMLGLQQHGHLVWACGWADTQTIAADITAGRLFLSASLVPDPAQEQDLSAGLAIWYGGLVLGAHLELPDQNPWGDWRP